MSIVDYTTLTAAVKDWANRLDSSVSARVPDFIRLGEDRIWRTNPGDDGHAGVIRSQWDITRVTLTIIAGQNWVALPADWLEFERITLPGTPTTNNGNLVEYMPPDMLEDLPAPGNANVYSIEGGRLLYGMVQAAGSGLNQDLTVKYHAHPGYLVDAATTWLLQKAPSIYLYAALVEAAIYIKKPDKVGEYGALLDQAISGFKSTERASLINGSRMRYRRA